MVFQSVVLDNGFVALLPIDITDTFVFVNTYALALSILCRMSTSTDNTQMT